MSFPLRSLLHQLHAARKVQCLSLIHISQRDIGAAADVQALQVACSHAVADEMKLERFHG